MMIITHTLVISPFLLKDFTQHFSPLSSALGLLVLHWITPINKHVLMSCVSKTNKIPWPPHFPPAFPFTAINGKTPQRRCLDMLPLTLLPHSVLNPLQSSFLLTIPLKLLLSCSPMITMILSPVTNSQSSCHMTYIGYHMSQFALGSLVSPVLPTWLLIAFFHLKISHLGQVTWSPNTICLKVAHSVFRETLSALGFSDILLLLLLLLYWPLLQSYLCCLVTF